MRRSICLCEPYAALAGQHSTWKFIYTTSNPLPKGTRLKFDIQSKGRDIDWQVPDINIKNGDNVIYALLEDGEILNAREVETPDSIVPQYEFTLSSQLKTGSTFTIVMGPAPKAKDAQGNVAQRTIQRRRSFLLYIDPKGKGNYEEPEIFSMDIRGNVLHAIRILSPSFVAKNKRFDITVRFEDQYGNLTSHAPPDTLIDLSYEHLRENLNWKLFVPETGFVILPNLYFNEAGIYKIQLRNLKTKEVFTSAPIKCFPENGRSLFWGLLHGESERVDSTENIESCLRHFRDEKAMNFYATSCFESIEETPNEIWKLISQNITDFNEEDRFITILGCQWQGDSPNEGLRQIVYFKDNKPILRKKDGKSNQIGKIYKSVSAKELISVPSFTMGEHTLYDFKEFTPEFERVVEIYNAWGSSECTTDEGNLRPITAGGGKGIKEKAQGSIRKALSHNCRFGFVAGGLDDRGAYSDFFESDQIQYSPGITGVICDKHTRETIMEAIFNRSCYATTGARIIVGFEVAGQRMGGELTTATKPGLSVNRHLSGYVAGTASVRKVEIIRNGKIIKVFEPNHYTLDFTYDDMDTLADVVIDAKDGKPPFAYYYIRVIQEDGHIAWGSPIWVDYVPDTRNPKANKNLAKPIAKPAPKTGKAAALAMLIPPDIDMNAADDDELDDAIEEPLIFPKPPKPKKGKK